MAIDLAYICAANLPLYYRLMVAWFVFYPNFVVIYYVYRGRLLKTDTGLPVRFEREQEIDVIN